MQITPLSNQTILDAAIQTGADAARTVELAQLWGLSVTDDITPGVTLTGLTPANGLKQQAALFAQLHPASGLHQSAGTYTQPPLQSWVTLVAAAKALVSVLGLQTVLDVVVQCAGAIEGALAYAAAAGLSLTDDLTPGSSFTKPAVVNSTVVNALANRYPASGIDQGSGAYRPGGIGYWFIGFDFVVS